MSIVFKYPIPIQDDVQIVMPEFAKILHIGQQGDVNELVLWAQVDPKNATVPRFFQVRGTGEPLGHLIDVDGKYIGSVIFPVRPGEVWHVWEVKP